jgi:hypothetical protein
MLLKDWSFDLHTDCGLFKKNIVTSSQAVAALPSCSHPPAYENIPLIMHSNGPKPNFVSN